MAAAFGLPVAECKILHGQVAALCVTRVDRANDATNQTIHMEDFCQIEGIDAHEKYAREGGPKLLDIVRIIREYSAQPALDLRSLLRWSIFSFLIGFGAAHAKQIALLFGPTAPSLAPFFGLWSTHVYPGMNFRMGFPLGGEDRPDWLTAARWREFAGACGIRPSFVLSMLGDAAVRIPRLAAEIEEQFQRVNGHADIVRQIRALIDQRARQVLVSLEAERLETE